ncbi:MAG: hypothetical protein Q9170_002539 [Blastenia crenularia]
MPMQEVGLPIPADTPHAVSVSLPTWESCVAYEEGEEWVLKKMNNGYPSVYPRFFIDNHITSFASTLVEQYATQNEWAMLLPSHAVALRCSLFFQDQFRTLKADVKLRIIDIIPVKDTNKEAEGEVVPAEPMVSAVLYPKRYSSIAKSFWQHTGEGISSRRAELCHRAFIDGFLIPKVHNDSECASFKGSAPKRSLKGPLRYQRGKLACGAELNLPSGQVSLASVQKERGRNADECAHFVEERYGRNLHFSHARKAKLAIRRRIAGGLTAEVGLNQISEAVCSSTSIRQVPGFSEDDVFLYPSGMSSIFNTHRVMMACRGKMKSVCFGFPYIDTLKILEKWGPGCQFYGNGSAEDLDDLESRCKKGERFLALFCEFPVSRKFSAAIAMSWAAGKTVSAPVVAFADKSSLILNPLSQFYGRLKETIEVEYEDNYWAEDALFMERNSRDFVSRIARINVNAEAICSCLRQSTFGQPALRMSLATTNSGTVKHIYYPMFGLTKHIYDQYRKPTGRYGGLLSVTFGTGEEAVVFYNALETAKGPSLGTNFTLRLVQTTWLENCQADEEQLSAAQYGVEPDLVRMSVGLEDTAVLCSAIEQALAAVAKVKPSVKMDCDDVL